MKVQAGITTAAPAAPKVSALVQVCYRMVANLMVVGLSFGLAFTITQGGDKASLEKAIRGLVSLDVFKAQLLGIAIGLGVFIILGLFYRKAEEKDRIKNFLRLLGDESASAVCGFGALLTFVSFSTSTNEYLWQIGGCYLASFGRCCINPAARADVYAQQSGRQVC
ncbi:hypothetical protein ACUXQ2_005492 [Cupriavidus metallidurans]